MLAQRESPLWDSASRVTDGWRVEGVAPIWRADYALLLAPGNGAWAQSVSAASLNGALRVKMAGKPVIGVGLIFWGGEISVCAESQGQETAAERIVCRGVGQTVCCWRMQLGHFVMARTCQIDPVCRFVVLSVARIERRFGRFGEARERGLGRQGLARQSAIDETCLTNWNIYDNSFPPLKFVKKLTDRSQRP